MMVVGSEGGNNDMEPRIGIVTLGVRDWQRSYEFHHRGLGFPTTRIPEQGIIFFQTGGTCLALYPHDKLAEDVAPNFPKQRGRFPGIALAHITRTKNDVDEILKSAEQAGGKIEKTARIASWGGYSGYFSDPAGYLWEVAWAEDWRFHEDGSLVIE
jgi:catechol 2,3-dioxygenase-like lactoylglutathione lyase family enzyme